MSEKRRGEERVYGEGTPGLIGARQVDRQTDRQTDRQISSTPKSTYSLDITIIIQNAHAI